MVLKSNTAGYVTRALKQKLQRSAHPLKQQLILCLKEYNDTEHPSREWVKVIDRGGLTHVDDITYMFFSAMEVALCKELEKTSQLSSLPQIVPVIEIALFIGKWCQPTGKLRMGRHFYY